MRFLLPRRLLVSALMLPLVLGLGGCDRIALPPIQFTLPLGPGFTLQIPGAGQTDFPSAVGVFCNLLTPADLDQLLQDAGAPAGLINLDRVILIGLNFSADQSDFSSFTEATFSIQRMGDTPIEVGTITNPSGLGSGFTITPNRNINLLVELATGECAGGMLVLRGTEPEGTLQYSLEADLDLYTSLNI